MKRLAAAISLGVMLAGCGGGGGDGQSASGNTTGYATLLQGAWSDCRYFTGWVQPADLRIRYSFSGSTYTYAEDLYSTTNSTCGGEPLEPPAPGSGTFVVGDAVTTTLGFGGPTITAYKVDRAFTGGAAYDLFYIDTGPTPHRLYYGDSDTGDGRSAAARPTVIWAGGYLEKQ